MILLNEAGLVRFLKTHPLLAGAEIVLAGPPQAGRALRQTPMPRVRHICTDFRRTASLTALKRAVTARGGVNHLILAADGASREAMFSVMSAVVALLPALRRKPGARILLAVRAGAAVGSLHAFVTRAAPCLAREGIAMRLEIEAAELALPVASTAVG